MSVDWSGVVEIGGSVSFLHTCLLMQGDCVPDELSRLIIEKGQVDRRMPNPDDKLLIFNGRTGELMKSLPAPNNIRLHRRNFLRLLTDAVDVRV